MRAYSAFSHSVEMALDPVLQDVVMGTRWSDSAKAEPEPVGKASSKEETTTKSSGKKDEPIHVEVSTPNSSPVTLTPKVIEAIDTMDRSTFATRGRGGVTRGGRKG